MRLSVLAFLLVLNLSAFSQPIALYSFYNGTAKDITGNGHDGRLIGNPESVGGILNNALRFDGIDDIIEVPTSPDFVTETVRLTLWFMLEEAPLDDYTLISKETGTTGYRVGIEGTSSRVFFNVRDGSGGTVVVRAPSASMPGVWTHVLATYDGAEIRLYLHGILVASHEASGLRAMNERNIYIGGQKPSGLFKGRLDQISIGARGVTDQQACGSALKIWDQENSRCLDAFVDVTESLGIADTVHRHFGIAVVDANNDGWVDLYYPNGLDNPVRDPIPSGVCPEPSQIGPPDPENFNTFYLNNGDGTFGLDIAAEAGVDDWWNAMRHVWGDFDNDGMRDLLSHNFIKSSLYRAVSLDPLLYEDVTASSGLEICITNGTGASWIDLNNDGWLDVYACEYDPNRNSVDHVNKMFLNNGNGRFIDVSDTVGLLPDNPMGVAFADYDNDGDQDFFVTNSHAVPFGAPSRLYRNDGWDQSGIPTFTDIGAEAGVDLVGPPGRGFSAAWGDYDNDGRLDLLYGREEDSELFHNDGPNGQGIWTFSAVAQQGGLNFDELEFQDGNFGDLNNDGWLDILMANAVGPNRVFLNNQDGTWVEISELIGMEQPDYFNQGVVPADVDNDGDLDVVWYGHDLGDPNTLYRNDARGNNWIQFRLTGTESNRDAVGARLRVKAALKPGDEPVSQMREIAAGTGFFSDLPRVQTFGLGKATRVLSVEITWPSGTVQRLGLLEANQRYDIIEPGVRLAGRPGAVGNSPGEQRSVPLQMSLDQNYPNPFNPSTVLSFSLPETSPVTLTVFNLLGEDVAVLVSGTRNAGIHTIQWDAAGLPAGVYLYRLEAGGFSETRKLLLLR